ncbi:ABC transporter ATP-binding protein [Brachybacterium subflavum]|uniref:ABC transporter ATP-binding protein n=1 Tax=Brachybacterium subflavum TaxID=2585206 RepID=UPI001D0CFEDB|nr:ABC transporter ATP-binding protein [Brachybacterium subflavum]
MKALEVRGLVKSFGSARAVDGLDLDLYAGEVLGILGPNGAGKTTTLECICGMTHPDGGRVRVQGLDPAVSPRRVREILGYQMQSTALPAALRVREAVDMFAALHRDPADGTELLELVGLREVRTRAFGTLSGGQRQRLAIALALIGRPQIVVLDEITTGLDPVGRREVWTIIDRMRENGTGILLVSHAIDEVARLCDRICVIVEGVGAFTGPPQSLVTAMADAPTGEATDLEDAYLALVSGSAERRAS